MTTMNHQTLGSSAARISPFKINVPQEELNDLKYRLKHARWPSSVQGDGWQYGVPVHYLKKLAAYWLREFDWKKQEAKMNQYPQFTCEIDGANIHFIHV